MTDRNFRKRILREARDWIGTPYLHQASVKQRGADCLGLIRGVWRQVHGEEPQSIPNYSPDWGEYGNDEPMLSAARKWCLELSQEEARAGDIILFRWKGMSMTKHAGILSGRKHFIHAYEKSGVVETTLGRHWRKQASGYFRIPQILITRV